VARLIVTGATGFIGRPAVQIAVERGFTVDALCTRRPGDPHPGVTYHEIDLLEERQRARGLVREIGASHCLHLAWYTAPRLFWTSRENYRWTAATLDLAEAFAQGGGQRLVGAGTCAEYGWHHGFCSEAVTPLEPATPYGIAKNAVRDLLESWSREAGVSLAWGRIFFVYGPGEHRDRLVASVVRALLRGERARCSDGLQVGDFLHVRDVADAFVTLVAGQFAGALNIASGNPVQVRAVAQQIADQIGRPDLLDFGSLPSPQGSRLLFADTRRLRQALKWSPQFDLDVGLRDAIAWHRRHGGE
jgi:nucleoside-diphosphate-sugar epimerase